MNNYNEYQDFQLLTLLRENGKVKEHALNALWKRYSNKLYNFCLFKIGNNDEAEEAHQLAWIKFYEYALSGREIKNLPAFLYSTAYLVCKEKYRQKVSVESKKVQIDDIETIADHDYFLKIFENDELLAHVSLTIETLDEKHKEVFLLRWFGELKYEEIAGIVDETPDCVRVRCNRAMGKVIQLLSPIINEINKGTS